MTTRTRRPSVRGALSTLLLALAFCALALAGYQTTTGRWHATPVLSGSMRPGLQPGDVVLTKRVPISDLRVRDVIVYHPPNEAGRQRVHRIVKLKVSKGTTTITTRGDANSVDDPLPASLSGASAYRVARVVPLVGYPAVWLSHGIHGMLTIGLGALLLIGAVFTAIRPEKRHQRNPASDAESSDPSDTEPRGATDSSRA